MTSSHRDPAPEQLSLLTSRDLPVRFRLDERTRLRGLAHIAQIRAQMAARHPSAPRRDHQRHSAARDRAA